MNQFRIGLKLNDPESPVDNDYLDELEKFVINLENSGAKIIRNKLPDIDNELHFMIYLKLVGASDSPHFTKEQINALTEGVRELNNDSVSRICGTRFEGLSLLHRDWINLNKQRNKHRLAFDTYFEDQF